MIDELLNELQKLKLSENGEFKRVEHALDSEPFTQVQSSVPACLLLLTRYDFLGRMSDNRPAQRVDEQVSFWLICKVQEFESRFDQVAKLLQGYQFEPEASGFLLTHGEQKGLHGGLIWWQQEATTQTIRQ